jgi:hypothetical protein
MGSHDARPLRAWLELSHTSSSDALNSRPPRMTGENNSSLAQRHEFNILPDEVMLSNGMLLPSGAAIGPGDEDPTQCFKSVRTRI